METSATEEQAGAVAEAEVGRTEEQAGAVAEGGVRRTYVRRTDGAEPEAYRTDLGGQVRSTVGRLYRRFRSERPEGSLGDAALEVLTRLHKAGPQTLTELSELARVSPASMSQ